MERPTSLMAWAQTWSNYKQHNTCNFLIGVTPQGWGGRVSDVYITEHKEVFHSYRKHGGGGGGGVGNLCCCYLPCLVALAITHCAHTHRHTQSNTQPNSAYTGTVN